jgi:hypothetical protein
MDEVNGVAGGQGRSAAEVAESAGPIAVLCLAVLALVAAMVVCMLTGCATTYHERDGELKPNTPSAKEMRESLGVF